MNELANHLWQSTAFAVLVWLLTMVLRRNSARPRYWLWLAASIKFLIPFSPVVSIAEWITRSRLMMPGEAPVFHAATVSRISTYFAPAPTFPDAAVPKATSHWLVAIAAVWLAGSLLLLVRWFRRWRRIDTAARSAKLLWMRESLPVLSSSGTIEPGIFGILRPVLLLPEGIADNLTPEQFEAIVAHEFCHARYRDNLTAAVHMCVETLFWFHPLVWWIGAKMIEERERDCDEAVLKQGSRPGDYAQGIVTVCKSYVESPLACAAGITGADLKNRIREIMMWRGSRPVTLVRKLTLAAAGIAALTIPLAIGIIRAQTLPSTPAYTYQVVSVHPSAPGQTVSYLVPGAQGGMHVENMTVMDLLRFAYRVPNYRFSGAPGWVSSDPFDVNFTPDKPETKPDVRDASFMSRNEQRMQAVLRDRFGLILRAETRELPIYALVLARGDPKLSPSSVGKGKPTRLGRGQITANDLPMKALAVHLTNMLDRPVVDETGLAGQYDFTLKYTPDSPGLLSADEHAGATTSPSIFTALTEQLGLRLESKKGPVQVYVIEKIEKPGEN